MAGVRPSIFSKSIFGSISVPIFHRSFVFVIPNGFSHEESALNSRFLATLGMTTSLYANKKPADFSVSGPETCVLVMLSYTAANAPRA